jgi:hypothetical protein
MQIPVKPLTVNKKFTINKGHRFLIKTNIARDFEKVIADFLELHKKDIIKLMSKFNPKVHALHFYITIYAPSDVYFTKDGKVSARCIDASNAIKILEDSVYKFLDVGDHYNTKVTSEKLPHQSKDWITKFEIKIVDKPSLTTLV